MRHFGFALAVVAVLSMAAVAEAADASYHLRKEIAVGGDGGWDYLTVDSDAHRLYVAHATKVVVIDTESESVVGEIPDVAGSHGFAIAPDLGRGFATAGRAGKVVVVDLKTLATVATVTAGENPDAILYEPVHQEVYAFNHTGKSVTVFDAKTGDVRATIPLGGTAEFAVLDREAGRIYNNLEDTSQLAVIDASAHRVSATWPIAPGEEATGLAFDDVHHRLFVGCGNKVMEMMDSATGHVLGSVPIGAGVDATAFDPGTGLAFASSSDGTLTSARVDDAGTLRVVQTIATPPRSRTMTLDPKTHRLYVATASFAAPSAGTPPGRPSIVPGSFKVLVYEIAQ